MEEREQRWHLESFLNEKEAKRLKIKHGDERDGVRYTVIADREKAPKPSSV